MSGLYHEEISDPAFGTENFRFSVSSIKKLLGLGIPMGLQFSITAIGTTIQQGAVNVYGAVYIAGFSAASKLQNIISTVFVSFGATVATFVDKTEERERWNVFDGGTGVRNG